ncbi:MAG: radical SAM protein [Hahellaceae bacterium]|nr:radical SAM protein [Hahellaceae bacterium]
MKLRRGPDGYHFFDRMSGMNFLLDEAIPAPETWSQSPRQISIALTNQCDLSCPHCYAPKTKAKLDSSQIKLWMTELDQHGCFGVGFGGGEPTLHPDLLEICDYGHLNTNLAITMTTHGHHLTDNLLSNLSGKVNFVRVSMDGVGKTYEAIRNRPFDRLLSILNKLGGYMPYGINFVVNQQTIPDIAEAALIAEDLGASDLLLLPEEAVGKGRQINPTSKARLQDWVAGYSGKLQLSVGARNANDFPTTIPLQQEPPELAFAHIDADGVLKRTSFDNAGYKIDQKGVIAAFSSLCYQQAGAIV